MPFDASEFDTVVANFVFHHLANPTKVLSEAYRVLKDGGRLAFTVWSALERLEGFGLFLSAIHEHAASDVEMPHGPLFGVSDFDLFHEMMGAAGFRDATVTELDITWRISSLDDYLTTFRAWSNLDTLPESVQALVETAVRENAKAHMSDGVLTLANPGILASGTK